MTKQEMIDKLTEIDGYANEDVRLTMIDSVVTSLKKGIYPTKVLSRIETLISKHQKIKAKKQRIKKGLQLVPLSLEAELPFSASFFMREKFKDS